MSGQLLLHPRLLPVLPLLPGEPDVRKPSQTMANMPLFIPMATVVNSPVRRPQLRRDVTGGPPQEQVQNKGGSSHHPSHQHIQQKVMASAPKRRPVTQSQLPLRPHRPILDRLPPLPGQQMAHPNNDSQSCDCGSVEQPKVPQDSSAETQSTLPPDSTRIKVTQCLPESDCASAAGEDRPNSNSNPTKQAISARSQTMNRPPQHLRHHAPNSRAVTQHLIRQVLPA